MFVDKIIYLEKLSQVIILQQELFVETLYFSQLWKISINGTILHILKMSFTYKNVY